MDDPVNGGAVWRSAIAEGGIINGSEPRRKAWPNFVHPVKPPVVLEADLAAPYSPVGEQQVHTSVERAPQVVPLPGGQPRVTRCKGHQRAVRVRDLQHWCLTRLLASMCAEATAS